MNAKVLAFPESPARLLRLGGCELIAWRHSPLGDYLDTLWRVISSGRYCQRIFTADGVHYGGSPYFRKAGALELWRFRPEDPRFAWQHMMSEDEAFGVKQSGHARTPRVLAHA